MSRLPLRLGLFAAAVVVALSAGTAGFTAVDADRSVNVQVVDDDDAYVGVDACEVANDSSGSGGEPVRVDVTNRYTDPLTVDSVASDEADRTDRIDDDRTVGVGESERFTVVFDDDVDAVVVEVAADGFHASITQSVRGECPSAGSGGGGNATGSA